MGEAMGVEQLPTPTVADIGVFVVTKLGYCGYALILPCFLQPWLHVLSAPHQAGYLMTRTELLDRLAVLLGGRTAEELIFGDVSTGAQDDLQRATDLVRHMITRYGMSDALGLATFEAPRQALFLQVPTGAPREYSEETARVIDAEIQTLLEAAHTRVRETLTAQRALLESLATLLIAHEVVDRTALTQLLGTAVPEEVPYAPVGADLAAETIGAIKPQVTSSLNGEQMQARDSQG
jgi:cell division protease FtsH